MCSDHIKRTNTTVRGKTKRKRKNTSSCLLNSYVTCRCKSLSSSLNNVLDVFLDMPKLPICTNGPSACEPSSSTVQYHYTTALLFQTQLPPKAHKTHTHTHTHTPTHTHTHTHTHNRIALLSHVQHVLLCDEKVQITRYEL